MIYGTKIAQITGPNFIQALALAKRHFGLPGRVKKIVSGGEERLYRITFLPHRQIAELAVRYKAELALVGEY